MYEIDSRLPLFLKNSIRRFILGKKEYEEHSEYNQLTQEYNDLKCNIDLCEYDNIISADDAQRLRKQYLEV